MGRQVTAAWCPHPPTTAAPATARRPGAHSTDGVMILWFLREHKCTHETQNTLFHTPPPSPPPPPPHRQSPLNMLFTQHAPTHKDKCTPVPKLNSIYQSCCIECIIYIHKWSFILILNYILCFKEMHCVKRIKCYGWTYEVTFLYHPGSSFPPNTAMMMLMAVDGAVMRNIHTGN